MRGDGGEGGVNGGAGEKIGENARGDGEVVGASEDEGVWLVRLEGGESGGDVVWGEGAVVDLFCPVGAVWFVDVEVRGVFALEILIAGGAEGGRGGEDEDLAVSGELGGCF